MKENKDRQLYAANESKLVSHRNFLQHLCPLARGVGIHCGGTVVVVRVVPFARCLLACVTRLLLLQPTASQRNANTFPTVNTSRAKQQQQQQLTDLCDLTVSEEWSRLIKVHRQCMSEMND